MVGMQNAFERLTDDELKTTLTETSKTIQQLTLALLIFAAFAISVASVPDVALLLGDNQVSLPSLGGMPLTTALVIGPIILISMRLYLERYVVHWRQLYDVAQQRELSLAATISPMRDGVIGIATFVTRYGLVPVAMAMVTWKALGDPVPLGLMLLIVTAVLIVVHLIQDISAYAMLWGLILTLIVFTVLLAISLYTLHSTLQKLPHVARVQRAMDLRYADLSDKILDSRILTNANLKKANLEKADLVETDLRGANLWYANLENARLWRAKLWATDMRQASLVNASFNSAQLWEADLRNADLSCSRSTSRNPESNCAHFAGADFRDAKLQSAKFDRSKLSTADFRCAYLENASFSKADLANADFRGARGLTCAQLNEGSNWQDAMRDDSLGCGAAIPSPYDPTTIANPYRCNTAIKTYKQSLSDRPR